MTRDFDKVRTVASHSLGGRAFTSVNAAVTAAWANSAARHAVQRLSGRLLRTSAAQRLRCCAWAIAIATALHLVLRTLMPATVVPAVPITLIVVVVAFAVVTAWQAERLQRAWRHSRLSRLFARSA